MLEPDRDQIEQFVEAIFRHAASQGFCAIRSFFEDDDAKPARLSSASLTAGLRFLIDVAEDDARRAAQHPRPIVFCPPLATFADKERARESDLVEGLALSVECDEQPLQARAALEAILGAATVVVRSGGRFINGGEPEDKLHLHWRLAKPARGDDLKKLKEARDLAARIVGGDPSNKPVCHPIRWPGSWHRKAEPRLCEIAALDPDREIELDEALCALIQAAPEITRTPPGDRGGDNWPELVSDIITGASFHAPLVSLAARLVGSNMHDGTTVKLLRGLMLASTAEHDALRWQARYDSIPRIVATAREKFAHESEADPQPKPRSLLIWYGEAPQPAPAYLVDETLPEIGLAIVGGQYGAAKTFAAADLTAAVILGGGDFAGKSVRRKGGILWLAAEGAGEIEMRVHAAIAGRGGDAEAPQPFARQDGQVPCLGDREAAARLRALTTQAAERMRADFNCELAAIAVDTLSAAAGFDDENSAAETQRVMTMLAALASETRALVLVLDHYGKIADTGVRGSSAKSAAADAILACLGDRDQATGAISNRRLAVAKLRGGPTGRVIPFELTGTEDGSTCVVVWRLDTPEEPAAAKRKPWPKSLIIFKRALNGALCDLGKDTIPRAGMPLVKAVDSEAVRAEFYRLYVADTPRAKRVAFNRCAKDAVERGVMYAINVGPDLGRTIFWTP
jgi:hypothetical protein